MNRWLIAILIALFIACLLQIIYGPAGHGDKEWERRQRGSGWVEGSIEGR